MVSTDEQLVSRMSQGDRTAFAEIYDRHAPRVLGLLVRLLPTGSDAEDVLQEVFWQIWKTAGRYDPDRGSLRVWLSVITRSRAMDCLRRQKPKVTEEDYEPAVWTSPSAGIEQTETSTKMQGALSQLTVEQQEPIRLAYYNGLVHQEISERLQIPLGTVKTRIRSGMRRLRALLAETASSSTHCAREATS